MLPMTHDPDAKTLAVLIYEKLFTERRDAAYAWTDYVADLKSGRRATSRVFAVWLDGSHRPPGWEFASD